MFVDSEVSFDFPLELFLKLSVSFNIILVDSEVSFNFSLELFLKLSVSINNL